MSIPTNHPFAFDPIHGLTLPELQAIRPPPAPPGFDAFWQARYASARRVDPQPHLSESSAAHPDWSV